MEKIEKVSIVLDRMSTKKYPANVAASLLVPLWTKIVGPTISAHSKPISYKNGRLLIVCESQIWCQELSTQKSLILEKAAQAIGKGIISNVEIIVKREQMQKASQQTECYEIKISERAFAFAEQASESAPKALRESFQKAILSVLVVKMRRKANSKKPV